LHLEGPLGRVNLDLSAMDPHGNLSIKVSNTSVHIHAAYPSLAGLWQGRLSSLIEGVTNGHVVSLILRGIGYRAKVDGQYVYLKLGTSHDTLFIVPEGIRVFAKEPTQLILFGVDRAHVCQVAASLQALRPPSSYQAKGIYLADQIIRRKAGKRK
jgi:large subunit ribosomal protein L6